MLKKGENYSPLIFIKGDVFMPKGIPVKLNDEQKQFIKTLIGDKYA